MTNRTSLIHTWKPKMTGKIDQLLVTTDDNILVIYFNKKFAHDTKIYNRFSIKKTSYEKQLELIARYLNFFMNCYDEDDELITAYLKLKFELDHKHFDKDNMELFISYIYEIIFTPTIVEKIKRLISF